MTTWKDSCSWFLGFWNTERHCDHVTIFFLYIDTCRTICAIQLDNPAQILMDSNDTPGEPTFLDGVVGSLGSWVLAVVQGPNLGKSTKLAELKPLRQRERIEKTTTRSTTVRWFQFLLAPPDIYDILLAACFFWWRVVCCVQLEFKRCYCSWLVQEKSRIDVPDFFHCLSSFSGSVFFWFLWNIWILYHLWVELNRIIPNTLDIQTPPEKFFWAPTTYPKHLLRSYLDVYKVGPYQLEVQL